MEGTYHESENGCGLEVAGKNVGGNGNNQSGRSINLCNGDNNAHPIDN